MKCKGIILIVAIVFCISPIAQASFSLDDIEFWAGSGSNSAAMVIHWSAPEVYNLAYSGGASTPMPAPITELSLAWGYNFDGTATGWDMMTAIAATDDRLYVVGGSGTVQGIGYDLDGDGQFGISDGDTTYTEDDFTDGVLDGLGYNVDSLVPTDSGDLYWGGWYGPNWELWFELGGEGGYTYAPDRGDGEYWTPTDDYGFEGVHGEWQFSEVGIAGINLEDESWVGWSVAAAGLDYTDPTDEGTVAWINNKQAPVEPIAATSAVPVPAAVWLLGSGLLGLIGIRRRRAS
ncbi:VPLPA-CTERM sorting domain-containing protein [uncultured Desulfosarcina sp.]|uniref:VPLPA-CTERM sorting domain-containing protein n=1 Tax=uncultured Desulfosarcina sp. TaxID=218289 RepID=UPI0029C99784|nr:VPLPA-CTERM sorting domain-containing protein [uncultured Desulfosarcina sp.]